MKFRVKWKRECNGWLTKILLINKTDWKKLDRTIAQKKTPATIGWSWNQWVQSFTPVLEQDPLDGVVRVSVLRGPARLHLQEDVRRKRVVGLQAHLHEEEVVAPQSDDAVVGVAERRVGVQRHQQLQRGVELHHWEGLEPAGTHGRITSGFMKRFCLFKVDKTSQEWHYRKWKKRLSPLHTHTDMSVANVVSWVNTNPDNFQIPPADDFLRSQTNTHSVFKLNVCSVYLDSRG